MLQKLVKLFKKSEPSYEVVQINFGTGFVPIKRSRFDKIVLRKWQDNTGEIRIVEDLVLSRETIHETEASALQIIDMYKSQGLEFYRL